MDSRTLNQLIDFQSIVVEELEQENYDTAQEFAEDVLEQLQKAQS